MKDNGDVPAELVVTVAHSMSSSSITTADVTVIPMLLVSVSDSLLADVTRLAVIKASLISRRHVKRDGVVNSRLVLFCQVDHRIQKSNSCIFSPVNDGLRGDSSPRVPRAAREHGVETKSTGNVVMSLRG